MPEHKTNPTPAGERLAKRIARAGICSRREAEKLITEGRVSVDRHIATSPALNVTPDQQVRVDGELLPPPEATRLWLYHKPAGLITSSSDKDGPTVFSRLPPSMPRVIAVGRLDLNTEGLLLLTNDGGLARHLELPSTGWKRRYRVRFFGTLTPAYMAKLKEGITIDGVRYGPVDITLDEVTPHKTHKGKANKWAKVSLQEGKNREIRKLFAHANCNVSRLLRTSYGPFQLGKLEAGHLKEVTQKALKEALGRQWKG